MSLLILAMVDNRFSNKCLSTEEWCAFTNNHPLSGASALVTTKFLSFFITLIWFKVAVENN